MAVATERRAHSATLLLWGDRDGMASLLDGLSELLNGRRCELLIEGHQGPLAISSISNCEGSIVGKDRGGFRWSCSRQTTQFALGLVEPLLHVAGHQYLDVNGLAERVIIARDEYPADLS